MSYLIYNVASTRIHEVCKPGRMYGTTSYKLERTAKAALTKEVNKGRIARVEYAISESTHYRKNIEKMETVINLMSGKEVQQSVNTPRSCDVSSELYWSM